MGSDATGGTEPLLEAGTTELGMRLQGGWTGDSKKRSRVLELLSPPLGDPESWVHKVALRTSLWPLRQPMPQG